MVKKVIFYTKENCTLCEEAFQLLLHFQRDHDFHIEERNINENDEWLEKYLLQIPVVTVNGSELNAVQINLDSISQLIQNNECN